ncbi:hypothetical protein SDRG_03912 [Saprolegnia diclina VS20]|uniref:C2H2-type domain-containing protein n=1 Tax=Saprolegnia diclina (strain VS20) TaxID=1156394 RepID=T0S8K8_SAPDV|nr:hypothetical protein SDRG_03912 [Saprolegnia diclina VS20]EQC38957.1 hypothetical protein SDRG_03912 [Saprolegnia diclina VS20]|eukprot:XP_008607781.1 hypothetical protein SDRG_03912 [Saprolegnia diclina VS20]
MATAVAAAKAKTKGKRLLQDVLNAHGDIETSEEKASALANWNKRKTLAQANGGWQWRSGDSPYLLPQHKIDPSKVAIEVASLVHIGKEMDAFLAAASPSSKPKPPPPPPPKVCSWSLLHKGKLYVCSNVLRNEPELAGRRCPWHAPTCRAPTHNAPPAKITVPNDMALCLPCYAIAHAGQPKLQQTPVVIDILRLPGVRITDAQTVVDQSANAANAATKAIGVVYSATSLCTWQGFLPGQSSLKPFICTHTVLQHPVYLTYLPHCGYHAPVCVFSNTQRRGTCPDLVLFNQHGLCKNHFEAHLSTLALEDREMDVAYTSLFACPNVINTNDLDRHDKKHPLAPRTRPPPQRAAAPTLLNGRRSLFQQLIPEPVQTLWWQVNFLRKGPRVAIALQRVFRGNRARRRVHALKMALAAKKRVAACIFLQTLWRRRQAQRHVEHYRRLFLVGTHCLQRLVRGYLGRRRAKHLRALSRLYWVIGVTIAVHKAIATLRARVDLRRSDDTLAIYLFRRWRAARVLARAMRNWRARRAHAKLQAQAKFQAFMAAITIQRAWKLYLRRKLLQRRYRAAQCIQARTRGSLSRTLWAGDPGICFHVAFTNPKSGVLYRHDRVLPQTNASYSVPARRARYHTSKDHHMRKICTGPTSPFGHAYKDIDDLYRDMHGERCEAVPPITCKPPMPSDRGPTEVVDKRGGISELRLTAQPPTSFHALSKGLMIDMALYPVGTLVQVRMGRKRQMQVTSHAGRIRKQHPACGTVDIDYLPGLKSLRGIAITEEKNVAIQRLSIPFQPPKPAPPRLVEQAAAALAAVQAIDVTRPVVVGDKALLQVPDQARSRAAAYHELVVTLRHQQTDLLADDAAFINYVFCHHDLLSRYWLRLVHDIKEGVNTDPSFLPSPSGLDGFIEPLPAVAAALKLRLEQLGYPSDPSANGAPPRPKMTPPTSHVSLQTSVDDMHILFHHESTTTPPCSKDDAEMTPDTLSLADIHKLVYHLKSLPRQPALDTILKVTTRNIRTFVCSHPACGRCFSTSEGAKSHQHVHANKVRLVAGDPLVDQYMVKHWPPESPWRDDNYTFMLSKTGYFKCPHCDKEYRTKRELYQHATDVHGREAAKDRQSQTNKQLIWLGTGDRVEDLSLLFPPLFRGHQAPCTACHSMLLRPTARCRRYPSLSILSKDADAIIFTTAYPTFAPEIQLTCTDCGQLGGANQESTFKLRRYLHLEALVRDSDQDDWMIGYLYRPPPVAASAQEALIWGYDYRNELLLDTSRVICVRATQCVGYGMVYACSRTYFHRFHRGTSGHMEKFCRPLRPTSTSPGSKRLSLLLAETHVETVDRAQTSTT